MHWPQCLPYDGKLAAHKKITQIWLYAHDRQRRADGSRYRLHCNERHHFPPVMGRDGEAPGHRQGQSHRRQQLLHQEVSPYWRVYEPYVEIFLVSKSFFRRLKLYPPSTKSSTPNSSSPFINYVSNDLEPQGCTHTLHRMSSENTAERKASPSHPTAPVVSLSFKLTIYQDLTDTESRIPCRPQWPVDCGACREIQGNTHTTYLCLAPLQGQHPYLQEQERREAEGEHRSELQRLKLLDMPHGVTWLFHLGPYYFGGGPRQDMVIGQRAKNCYQGSRRNPAGVRLDLGTAWMGQLSPGRLKISDVPRIK